MKRTAKLLSLLLALALMLSLAACGSGSGSGGRNSADDAEEDEPVVNSVAVEVQTVEHSTMASESTVSGTVAASAVTDVYASITAQIQTSPLKVGDTVHAGQTVCTLDVSSYRDQLVSLQSNYNSTSASLASNQILFEEQIAQAEKNLSDTQALLEIGAASQAQLDSAELTLLQLTTTRDTTIRQLEDSMTTISSNMKTLQDSISKGTVTAPVSGVIVTLNADAGSYCSPSYPVATIADSSSLQVNVAVSEALLPKLSVGQNCLVTIGAVSDKTWTGTVKSISPSPNPVTNLYDLEIRLPSGTGAKAGLFASVTFATDASYNTITVPSDAILTSGNADYVFTVDENGVAHKVYVTRGQTSAGQTEITEGLSGGELLVTTGQTYLTEGTAVRIVSGAADDSASAVTVEDASL